MGGASAFLLYLFQCRLKTGEAFYDCRPFDEAAVGVGKPAEAVLDAGERCAGLHHVAEGHGFGEVHGQGGEDGNEDADADIGRPEGFLAEFAVGETTPVVADAEVTLFQTTCFGFAAVVKGDLFGMVAHTQEGGAVVGFSVLAVDVEVFEFAADEVGNQGADDGINQSNPDEVAVYGDVASADVEGLHAGERPQYGDERAEFGNIIDEGAEQSDAFVGEEVDVFGDALVGVVGFAGQAQAVVFVAFEPVLLELFGQVGAPAEDEAFLQPVAADDAADNHRHVAEVFDDERGHGRAVKRGERVVEAFVPRGDPNADGDGTKGEADEDGEHQPLDAPVRPRPKRAGESGEFFEDVHGWCVGTNSGRSSENLCVQNKILVRHIIDDPKFIEL